MAMRRERSLVSAADRPAGRSVGPRRSLDQLRPLALLLNAGVVAVGDQAADAVRVRQ